MKKEKSNLKKNKNIIEKTIDTLKLEQEKKNWLIKYTTNLKKENDFLQKQRENPNKLKEVKQIPNVTIKKNNINKNKKELKKTENYKKVLKKALELTKQKVDTKHHHMFVEKALAKKKYILDYDRFMDQIYSQEQKHLEIQTFSINFEKEIKKVQKEKENKTLQNNSEMLQNPYYKTYYPFFINKKFPTKDTLKLISITDAKNFTNYENITPSYFHNTEINDFLCSYKSIITITSKDDATLRMTKSIFFILTSLNSFLVHFSTIIATETKLEKMLNYLYNEEYIEKSPFFFPLYIFSYIDDLEDLFYFDNLFQNFQEKKTLFDIKRHIFACCLTLNITPSQIELIMQNYIELNWEIARILNNLEMSEKQKTYEIYTYFKKTKTKIKQEAHPLAFFIKFLLNFKRWCLEFSEYILDLSKNILQIPQENNYFVTFNVNAFYNELINREKYEIRKLKEKKRFLYNKNQKLYNENQTKDI